MTQEDKELLLKEICARLPYGIKVLVSGEKYFGEEQESYIEELVPGSYLFESDVILKPYLRPISSMTEEEKKEYENARSDYYDDLETYDWFNKHHFDYRGLIEKGLALEAPEGMYKID